MNICAKYLTRDLLTRVLILTVVFADLLSVVFGRHWNSSEVIGTSTWQDLVWRDGT